MFILKLLSVFLILTKGRPEYETRIENTDLNDWESFTSPKAESLLSYYDITEWVRQLHLQQCVFVEIGESFCAIFVEMRSLPSATEPLENLKVEEFFLGLCSCATIRQWDLCPDELRKERESDCIFTEATPYANTSARVHRRLCDVTMLVQNAARCNCSGRLAGKLLHKTEGFPTCFLDPLPVSLCSPRGVCGIAQCTGVTIKGIHSPRCTPACHSRQPFCEEIGPWTSIPSKIDSAWTEWSIPRCNNTCGDGITIQFAICYNQVTARPAIDCLGPGSFCCPENLRKCYCDVGIFQGVMRATRFTETCTSTEGCTANDSRTFTFEGVLRPRKNIDTGELYDTTDDRERFEESIGPARRLLRAYRSYEDYKKTRERHRLKRSIAARNFYRSIPERLDDEDDYNDDNAEEDGDEESLNEENDAMDDDQEALEEDEESEDETNGFESSVRGRRSQGKRRRVIRSDYEASVEGKPEVDERMRREVDDCEDDSTEAPQYYDYDSGASATCFLCNRRMQVTFITIGSILVAFHGW